MLYKNKGELETRSRLIVLTDMETEPDDSQTCVHLLMYANEIDIEGIVAVTSRWFRNFVFPNSIRDRIHAYGVVRDNLCKHAKGWPTEEELLAKVGAGVIGYGMAATGPGKNTSGSDLIISIVDKDDPRPVWVAINAGANTLGQALLDVKNTRSPEEVARFVSKIRVYDDSGQDDAGAWMCHTFPDLFYIRSRTQVFGLHGPTADAGPQPYAPLDQYDWAQQHIRTNHGVLGALYPQRTHKNDAHWTFMEGGGTGTWIGLANKGLFEPNEITWGGWGGRLEPNTEQVPAGQDGVSDLEAKYTPYGMYPQAKDTSWTFDEDGAYGQFSGVNDAEANYTAEDFAPMWRWRDEYTRDLQGRMDWCVMPYEDANHNPVAAFMGDEHRTIVRLQARAGETITLDASASHDPDGDALTFAWLPYPEAGTYQGEIALAVDDQPVVSYTVPEDAAGQQIHIVLRVTDVHPLPEGLYPLKPGDHCTRFRTDDWEPPMSAYRRIVIDVV